MSTLFGRLEPHANVSGQAFMLGFILGRANLLLNSSVCLLSAYCVSWSEDSKVNKADSMLLELEIWMIKQMISPK